jgi:hypothetical protein
VSETIYYKSGWYPTHDPTWYGPMSILLMVLEINVASICASVPIFWPVLRPYLGAIFVTREYSVKHEPREPSIASHERTGSGGTGLSSHYKDTFVMDLVDPFASRDGEVVQNRVGAANVGKKTRLWHPV